MVAKTIGGLAGQLRERRSQAAFMRASLRTMKWSRKTKKAILVGSPYHPNLGDQAQTLCTEQWLKQNYPDHHVVVIDSRSASVAKRLVLVLVSKFVGSRDLIFLHSGYHTTDLYPLELDLQTWIISRFRRNQIVVLPQTINFVDASEAERAAKVFSAHPDLTFICRDNESHDVAQALLPSTRILLYPDIVTSQIGTRRFDNPRAGIQLCVRRDVESLYVASGLIGPLERSLQDIAPTTLTDTNSDHDAIYVRRHLQSVIETSWSDFSRFKVTVTDRYHGVIFSLVAGTPVVVLESTDHKLRSGVRWFPPEIFAGYLTFASSPEEAVEAAARLYKADPPAALPAYFRDEFYAGLADELRLKA